MNKSDLIEALSKDTGLTIRKAEEVVKTVFNSMANALADGNRMEIRGFGSFKIKHYDGYTGKNPKQANLSRSSPKRCPFFNAATS